MPRCFDGCWGCGVGAGVWRSVGVAVAVQVALELQSCSLLQLQERVELLLCVLCLVRRTAEEESKEVEDI